ncbi:SDR family NAD(P)-dependent oxidoreductase [Bordetella genomosp. 13]|uniref:SDR family NAD(P)-dependent oxidoreductase n=1 Tax=Bordetella genomosp. 13 TaxID=463040 RepID=UPI0011A508B4|nr:SDR family oxidoreductase [Bordetella genomosp. 13]
MTGNVAVVTGAAGGIGVAVATTLARQGWRLVLTDRAGQPLDVAIRACEAATEVLAVAADVTREAEVQALVRQGLEHFGRLDGFVSNAGVAGEMQPIEACSAEVFQHTMAVNVLGTFLCLKHAVPALRAAGGGSFVAVGSTSSIRGRANLAGYVASKHAVLGLVRTAALEQVGTPVRINAVLPGPTQTAMIDAIKAMAANRHPGGAVARAVAAPEGVPDDVASSVAFLLSDASRHMNGAALVIDGGSTLA